jgi:hypothetical protein
MNIKISGIILVALGVLLIISTMLYDSGNRNRQAYYACLKTQEQIATSEVFKNRQLVYLPDCRK